ncbi:MAG: iron-containing alcohol dehydrogenase, partial [Acidimicrobiia bacterium]|nr:iron-containing alcohol dehydrogenase [Acidimicrobiia bacterium]
MTFRLAEAVDLNSLDEVFTKAVRPVLVVDPAVASHPALATIDWPTVPVASGEPTVESVSAAISAIELVDAATIVAIGGGSTLDTAKLA